MFEHDQLHCFEGGYRPVHVGGILFLEVYTCTSRSIVYIVYLFTCCYLLLTGMQLTFCAMRDIFTQQWMMTITSPQTLNKLSV